MDSIYVHEDGGMQWVFVNRNKPSVALKCRQFLY
jgi:hypothetical protein